MSISLAIGNCGVSVCKAIRNEVRLDPGEQAAYVEQGYADRAEYLQELADSYGLNHVLAVLAVLPSSEDFDGLVTMLEDGDDCGAFDDEDYAD